ncbi:ribosomal-protein-L7/L12-serine acetyltransferase [Pseudovibrio japonicus]|uniref:Ribosomal-protein-L7/L12-serine acetyltransferase n=1 Tax=Pseudovibrio japonicus TaxID=366534 RepID=A0ABQ3E3I4_9HYPH|nr:GNAT family N-acetyltransferase [Pseudovibrio japonicus]GHB24669.1 ribosomal-protein-L7/L12-serine acetyltransferase [Pseudovibrio japonicus]
MFPIVISTKRLKLRPSQESDFDRAWPNFAQNFEIVRWLTDMPWPPNKEATYASFVSALSINPEEGPYPFAIEYDGQLIGCVEIQKRGDLDEFPDVPSIGYWMIEDAQGHGFMLEACVAALHWGFAKETCYAFATRVMQDNHASLNLLKKLGFEAAGVCLRYSKPLQQDVVNIIMHLPRDRFEALHGDADIKMGAAL